MNNRLFSILFCVILSCFSALAQNEIITLKDGTIMKGYIAKQTFATGKVEIAYSELTTNVKVSEILNEVNFKRDCDELSDLWRDWAILLMLQQLPQVYISSSEQSDASQDRSSFVL